MKLLKLTSISILLGTIGGLLSLAVYPVNAQQASGKALNTGIVNIAILKTFDFEQITIDNTAGGIGFTAAKINPTCVGCLNSKAQAAVCFVETGEIRVKTNSATVVSSTVGILMEPGQSFVVYGYDDINTFKAIRTTATSATLDCSYSRLP